MSAADILERLQRDGLRVRSDGERVLLAPRERVTADVLELVRANKPALLEELSNAGAPSGPEPHPDLERRRSRLERDLAAHPEQRVAADVADAPLRPEPGAPVSVVIACRTRVGIVCAELHIPRERFDAALFLATLTATSERPS